EVPCDVPLGRWIGLVVRMTDTRLEIRVDGRLVLEYEDREHPLPAGAVGLRTWQREASFRGLAIRGEAQPFRAADAGRVGGVSGMWRPVRSGTASGALAVETKRPFVGSQAQRITFRAGEGAIGIENRGLNRWGLNFVAGRPYEGRFWMRAEEPAAVRI